jgi:RimJ/RimL family protein N-acetyltransferase
MWFESSYKCLSKQIFLFDEYHIEPIKYEDQENIRTWRNDQIKILRQSAILTVESQQAYFENVISKLFSQDFPKQILFGFYQNKSLIGYGGLVHIDLQNRNAEISFLLGQNEDYIDQFSIFIRLIQEVAKNLSLNKIFTYGYDIQDERFLPLINSNFNFEARLKEHVWIDVKYYDVLIYSKFID